MIPQNDIRTDRSYEDLLRGGKCLLMVQRGVKLPAYGNPVMENFFSFSFSGTSLME